MKRRTLLAAAPAGAVLASAANAASPPTSIALWHAMGGALGDTLQASVDKFNASQSDYQVQATYKGTYADLLTASIAAWRGGKAPSIAQVFDVGTADMMAAGRAVVDVYKLSEMTGVAIDPATYIPAVRGYYSLNNGKMGAAPFNSSTAVMWINKDAFAKAGLDPEAPLATWDDVIKAARVIKAKNAADIPVMTSWPTWSQFEQFAAIHNVEYATLNDGFGGPKPQLKIGSAPFVKQLDMFLSMQKEGLFSYQGRDGKPSPIFYAGKAAITFDSSSIYGQLVKSAAFKFAAAPLPYHQDIIKSPINSIIGGAAFWAMTAPGRSPAEYKAAASFFKFISQPENDSAWAEKTGYVPVTVAGNQMIESQGFYAQHPGSDVAVKQLTRTQPTPLSRGIRLGGMPEVRVIIEEEWEKAIQNGTPAASAMETAQSRGQAVINRFAQTLKA